MGQLFIKFRESAHMGEIDAAVRQEFHQQRLGKLRGIHRQLVTGLCELTTVLIVCRVNSQQVFPPLYRLRQVSERLKASRFLRLKGQPVRIFLQQFAEQG